MKIRSADTKDFRLKFAGFTLKTLIGFVLIDRQAADSEIF